MKLSKKSRLFINLLLMLLLILNNALYGFAEEEHIGSETLTTSSIESDATLVVEETSNNLDSENEVVKNENSEYVDTPKEGSDGTIDTPDELENVDVDSENDEEVEKIITTPKDDELEETSSEGDTSTDGADTSGEIELPEEETPEGEETPEEVEAPVDEETPEGEETPETPEEAEEPVDVETPEGEETPEEAEEPVDVETPEGEEAPVEVEAPVDGETPEGEETPEEVEAPVDGESPEGEEAPEEVETPADGETPEGEEILEEVETPVGGETPEDEDTLELEEDTAVVEEIELLKEEALLTEQDYIVSSIETEDTDEKITISWASSDDALTYDIEIDGLLIEGLTDSSYVFEKGSSDQINIRIRVITADGIKPWSETFTLEIQSVAVIVVPENLVAIETDTNIEISWDSVEGATGYDLKINDKVIENIVETLYKVEKDYDIRNYSISVRTVATDKKSEWSDSIDIELKEKLEGEGTDENPYIIDTPEKLDRVREDLEATYELTSDLDLSEFENWVPIGTRAYPFWGKFYGNGHKISNLNINRNEEYQGLFGVIKEGAKSPTVVINNLHIDLDDCEIRGKNYVGALVGDVEIDDFTVENCSVTGNGIIKGGSNVGGLFGAVNLKTSDKGIISNCMSDIHIEGQFSLGGIAGKFGNGILEKSYSVSTFYGKTYIGGLVGLGITNINAKTYIEDCYALGKIETSKNNQRGIVAALVGSVSNKKGSLYQIENCYGSVNMHDATALKKAIVGEWKENVRVINTYVDEYYCYIRARNEDENHAKDTSEMQTKDLYSGWDFENTWAIDDGASYPYLKQLKKPEGLYMEVINLIPEGKGTVDEPFIITQAQQLNVLRSGLSSHYILGDDIYLDKLEDPFQVIGNMTDPFKGTLDGKGYTIYGLDISTGDHNTGFFGAIYNAHLKNINIDFDGRVRGINHVGALVGHARGDNVVIENCHIRGEGKVSGGAHLGGLVGAIQLIGSDNNIIRDCSSTVDVEGYNGSVGGLVGLFSNGNIERCYTDSTVTGKASVGGLVGNAARSHKGDYTIKDSFALGKVISKGYDNNSEFHNAGGLIGEYSGTGFDNNNLIVENCYAAVDLSEGESNPSVKDYNKGQITGRYLIDDAVTYINNYSDGVKSGIKLVYELDREVYRTPYEMTQEGTYEGWDFDNVWDIDEGGSYPYLRGLEKPRVRVNDTRIFERGSGTQNDPYLISTPEGLLKMNYELDAHFMIVNDLDLSDYDDWHSIGLKETPFTGSLNGRGNTITGLKINNNYNNQGLISSVAEDAVIQDIRIELDDNIKGGENVGALVGYVALDGGKIKNCSVTGDGKIIASKTAGGLFGWIQNTGDDAVISRCLTQVDVKVSGKYAGGFAGRFEHGTIETSYSMGDIEGGNHVGGFIGGLYSSSNELTSELNRVFAIGSVKARSKDDDFTCIGGLIGIVMNYQDCLIKESYVSSAISLDNANSKYANGLVGYTGEVQKLTVIDSYYNQDINPTSIMQGKHNIPKTEAELKDISTFVNWDISEGINYSRTWNILSEFTFPWLNKLRRPDGLGDYEMVTGVTIENGDIALRVSEAKKETEELMVVIRPDNASNKNIIFASNDENIATVSEKGIVTAVSKGQVTITATTEDGGYTDTCLVTVLGFEKPQLPTGFSARIVDDSVELKWDESIGILNYELMVDGKIIELNTNEYIHSGLENKSIHVYKVRAVNEHGTSQWSTEIEKQIRVINELSVPSNITVTSNRLSLDIEWDDVDEAMYYEVWNYGTVIYRGADSSYVMTGLTPNTPYSIRVRAANDDIDGPWSEVIATKTLTDIPKNITITPNTNSISIVWDSVSGASEYDIEIDGVIKSTVDNQYIHSNIIPGTEHAYRIRSKNDLGISEWSELISNTTLLDKPSNFAVIPIENTVELSWDAIGDVTGYEVEVDGVIVTNILETNYTHEDLQANTTHAYRVRGIKNNIKGLWSDELIQTVIPYGDIEVHTLASKTSITVNWNPVDGADEYEIEVDGSITNVGNNEYYNHTGLNPSSTHNYRVRAKNQGGYGLWSNIVSDTTSEDISLRISTEATSTTIELTWNDISGADYKVLSNGKWVDVGGDTTYTANKLDSNTQYVFRVNASTSSSSVSKTISVYTRVGIPEVSEKKPDLDKIQLKWNAVDGATGYYIEVDGNTMDMEDMTEYLHENLEPNVWHEYRLRAYNDRGKGDWSEIIRLMTAPSFDLNLRSTSTINSVQLEWDKVEGEILYDIEVDEILYENLSEPIYLHEGLESNTMHRYRVRVKNAMAISNWTDIYEASTIPEVNLNVGEGKQLNFVMVIPYDAEKTMRRITFTYDAEELEVVDLCSMTPRAVYQIGSIEGTNMTIESYEPGEVVYRVDDVVKTVVNSIKLQTKSGNDSKVSYVIE